MILPEDGEGRRFLNKIPLWALLKRFKITSELAFSSEKLFVMDSEKQGK